MLSRRSFINRSAMLLTGGFAASAFRPAQTQAQVMTVQGPVNPDSLGKTLIHEHILVDFIGAAQYNSSRWNSAAVIKKVLPYLLDARKAGCDTFVDCTPNHLGREPRLLLELSKLSGLQIVTNTGYYGGSDTKYLPSHAFTESADQLAARWIRESKDGIEGTAVRPGFMKISVNPGRLSPISRKLVTAACRAHLKTGLTIMSHTGPAVAALEELGILEQEGVSPEAFVWVHAQNEKDWNEHIKAARKGAWISLDGLNDDAVDTYVKMLTSLKTAGYLHRVLVSHDAGWYDPGKPDGGDFRKFTTLFDRLLPALVDGGFTAEEISQITELNPAKTLAIRVRGL